MRKEQIGDCTLYLGSCEDILPTLGKVDAVVTDPPYGVTDHSWDIVVSPKIWMIGKCCIATATEPYATSLINDSPLRFKFDCVWVKNCVSNAINANRMPMRRHERVLVFGEYTWTPQKRKRTASELNRLNSEQRKTMQYANPDSVLEINSVNCRAVERTAHPSQKPVDLMQYIVASFTDGNILDPFMGSGTTGVACVKIGRKFIGIEKEERYFDIACKRIEQAYAQPDLFIEPPPKPVQEGFL
jgi:DNA modification methylase